MPLDMNFFQRAKSARHLLASFSSLMIQRSYYNLNIGELVYEDNNFFVCFYRFSWVVYNTFICILFKNLKSQGADGVVTLDFETAFFPASRSRTSSAFDLRTFSCSRMLLISASVFALALSPSLYRTIFCWRSSFRLSIFSISFSIFRTFFTILSSIS